MTLTQPTFVISGPSGTGKDTVIDILMARDKRLYRTKSLTTRPALPGDKKYRYVSPDDFMKAVAREKIIEWQENFGHLYGTSIEGAPADVDLLIEIDPKGALALKKENPEVCLIFLLPPSLEELEKRHIQRGRDPLEQRQKRLTVARTEIRLANDFDCWVLNDMVEAAAAHILLIMRFARARLKQSPAYRNHAVLEMVQSTFPLPV